VVPCSWCLLQAVEGLVEPAHRLRVRGVNEASELRAVDGLEECVMDKALLTSSWCTCQPLETARVNRTRMVADLMTGLKVSS
jgi:hypothetical protein